MPHHGVKIPSPCRGGIHGYGSASACGSTSVTECPWELLVPIDESCQGSLIELTTRVSTSNPDAAGLTGASEPRAPATVPEDFRIVGAEIVPDASVESETNMGGSTDQTMF